MRKSILRSYKRSKDLKMDAGQSKRVEHNINSRNNEFKWLQQSGRRCSNHDVPLY